MNENKQALQVAALRDGTVIDHIPSEKLFTIVRLLGLEHMTNNITIGFNLESKKLGRKGIIKIAGKFFCDEEINRISEPMATLFHVVDKDNCIVKCHYCEKEQKREEFTII